jgi:hypothetical protein
MLVSEVTARGTVPFPEHTGERIYMVPFTKKAGVPAFMSRWQRTVDAMLDGVDAPGEIFIMVDQKIVRANSTHRRPGMHIDGWWIPSGKPHPGLDLKVLSDAGIHGTGRHVTQSLAGHGHRIDKGEGWPDEALFLASDVVGCRALVGLFEGEPGKGGDCTHLDLSGGKEVVFEANRAYSGNVTMLHESMVLPADSLRTVVRLNVPGLYM